MNHLTSELRRHPYSLTRSLERLSPSKQEIVARKFERHYEACERSDCRVDPRFLYELVEEMRRGRIIRKHQ